jgi:hypothetical protein
MNKTLGIFTLLAIFVAIGSFDPAPASAAGQGGQGYKVRGFVDADGDGFNDNAPDADGDGIPNGQDEDFVKPADGTGQRWARAEAGERGSFWQRAKNMRGYCGDRNIRGGGQRGFGPGDGTGNGGNGPMDGSGHGPNSGDCDGSGSRGRRAR